MKNLNKNHYANSVRILVMGKNHRFTGVREPGLLDPEIRNFFIFNFKIQNSNQNENPDLQLVSDFENRNQISVLILIYIYKWHLEHR